MKDSPQPHIITIDVFPLPSADNSGLSAPFATNNPDHDDKDFEYDKDNIEVYDRNEDVMNDVLVTR